MAQAPARREVQRDVLLQLRSARNRGVVKLRFHSAPLRGDHQAPPHHLQSSRRHAPAAAAGVHPRRNVLRTKELGLEAGERHPLTNPDTSRVDNIDARIRNSRLFADANALTAINTSDARKHDARFCDLLAHAGLERGSQTRQDTQHQRLSPLGSFAMLVALRHMDPSGQVNDIQASGGRRLSRTLGLRDLVFTGIILVQPTAPMPLFGVVQQEARGHVVTTILIGMVAMLFTAISYGRMARAYPSAGSAYTYVGQEIHPALGFATGWSMLMDYVLNPLICTVWCAKAAINILPAVPEVAWQFLLCGAFHVYEFAQDTDHRPHECRTRHRHGEYPLNLARSRCSVDARTPGPKAILTGLFSSS